MKVRVQLYSQLREVMGRSEVEVDLPNGATVADLLEQLYRENAALRARDKSILVGIGLEFVDRTHELSSDDEVALMPPVQGG